MAWDNIWRKIQSNETITVNDVSVELFDFDPKDYVKPKIDRNLLRFRRERTSHDGTALFTIEAIQRLVVPILKREVYDKSSGIRPSGAKGIIYYCSPIIHHSFMSIGEFKGGWNGPMLKETFYMRYTSEWVI